MWAGTRTTFLFNDQEEAGGLQIYKQYSFRITFLHDLSLVDLSIPLPSQNVLLTWPDVITNFPLTISPCQRPDREKEMNWCLTSAAVFLIFKKALRMHVLQAVCILGFHHLWTLVIFLCRLCFFISFLIF